MSQMNFLAEETLGKVSLECLECFSKVVKQYQEIYYTNNQSL